MNENNHLEAVLEQLLQERAELDSVIVALQKRVGRAAPVAMPGQPLTNTANSVTPTSVVYRGAFFNLSVTKAAEKLLKTFGRPLKTPELVRAFKEAEYDKVKGDYARSIVYTALLRSKDFVKVLPDTWDLAERHPEAGQKKLEELAAKAKEKAKGKRVSKKIKVESKPTVVGETRAA